MNVLADLIARSAERFSERIAVVCGAHQATFEEMGTQTNALAGAMSSSLGLRKGDRVAILLPNCVQSIIADFALIKAALIRVPINPRYTSREIEHILRHSGSSAIVTDSAHATVIESLIASLPELRHAIVISDCPKAAPFVPWEEIIGGAPVERYAVETTDDDGYMIAYTSGTTGMPKGVVTTVASRWAGLLHTYANELFITPDDVMLHAASLAHGSGTKVLPYFAKGARSVVMPKFDPREFFRLVENQCVTTTWLVPTMIGMLVESFSAQHSLSSLHTIFYAGSPMPRPLLRRAMDTFGPIFVQIYGLTEAPQPDLILDKNDHQVQFDLDDREPFPAGYPAIGVSAKIVDDAGEQVPCGEIGELAVTGKHIMAGYWNDPAATHNTLRHGWCMTGDLARRDARGLHYLVGRRRDLIISGGFNVYPKEVEDVLYQLDAVEDCAVIGEPDPLWGEIVHAFVTCKSGLHLTEKAILEHCKQQLAEYKKPRRISLVSALPLTANGKPDKKQLLAMIANPLDACEVSR
jgi:acyl-CoA synthetase (AMP-forming)/AMP-acid ligase II